MKSIRKFLCALLAVAMCVSMLLTPVLAADTGHTHEGTLPQVSCTYINPLYADILTEADLVSRPPALASGKDAAVYATYATTVEGAGRTLREGMKDRQETVNVYIQIPADAATDEYLQELFFLIADAALVHTGVPTEGDYLAWQYGGWKGSAGGDYVGDNANLTYTYTLTYYTSAAQEDKVDSAVSKLLSDLNVSGKDDYTKILAVYDYICDNVTYDYDHLNDDKYKLQYTAYGALIDGTSVCQGYAVLLYRLALELGVDSRLIPGLGNGEAHGWNIVELNNLYYNADSTWDAGKTEYDYFLKCDDNFPKHTRDDNYATESFYASYPMSDTDYTPAGSDTCKHSYSSVVTAPTCTEQGYTTHTCSQCGDSYVDTYVDATGHSYGEWVVTTEPTCTEKGVETRTCSVCDATETREIDATGHSFGEWAVTTEPTCTEKGVETRTCSVCDATETRDLDALGHDIVDGACTRCGETLTLEAPTLLSIFSRVQTSCKATWTLVDHAEGYELWRTETPDDEDSWTRVKTVKDGSKDVYTNQGLTVGTTYYYKVRAYIGEEEASRVYSDFSEVKYMPAAVVFDGPYSNATFRIRLRWKEIGGADGYQIWRLDDTGTWKIVKTLGDKGNTLTNDQGATTAYSNAGLTAGKSYTYKMRAFAIPEEGVKVFGAYSDEFTVAVMPETPKATVTSTKAGRAELSWNAVNGAAGYQVWMADSVNGTYKIIKSITDGETTTYTKYDLRSGSTCCFKVRAYVEVDGKKTFGDFSTAKQITVK